LIIIKNKGVPYDEALRARKENLSKGMLTYYKNHVMINQGYKQWLWDVNGKRYLDLFAGIVTVSVGHCHPKVNHALKQQVDKLWHTTPIYLYPPIYEFTQKLIKKMPGDLNVCIFTNSGSEANDLAMYMSRLYTNRFDIVSLRNGYHGMSPYTMGITSMNTWKFSVPTSFGIHPTMNPDVFRGPWGGKNCRDSPIQTQRTCSCNPNECEACDRYVEQVQDVLLHCVPKGGKVAAFIAESIQGVSGAIQFPKDFIKRSVELVRANGGLYIADEVQTGFGRTGSNYWGFQNHGVIPDIVTMAKGIGNGFPMAAVVTRKEIADTLSQALFFNTFGGNPMACAVGSAVLDVIDEEKLQENCQKVGTHFLLELAKLRDEFEIVGDVRGKGLMIGFELVEDKKSRKPLPIEKVALIFESIKDMGILIGKGGLYGNVNFLI
jgi:alanine-glyoxylate transaminase/(R)-3-amino-2-methylpropionate-pyruvate transaminase